MKNTYKITGAEAIRIAERDGVTLHRYASLIFCIVQPFGWTGDAAGKNVNDYFPGNLGGEANSGAKYLGPDEDGIEPTWRDAESDFDSEIEADSKNGNLRKMYEKLKAE